MAIESEVNSNYDTSNDNESLIDELSDTLDCMDRKLKDITIKNKGIHVENVY